jgi:hypothetical protein
MSTYGVRTRFVDVLVQGAGRVTEAAFAELVAHARERGITSGERKALLEPADYLRTSRVLKSHGIGLDDIRFDDGAWKAAKALAAELGATAVFPELPNAAPGGTQPAGHGGPAPQPHGGTSLGPMSGWKVETTGAVIAFETKAGNRTFPAVVLTNPVWKDPEPARDLVAEHRGELAGVKTLQDLSALIRKIVTKDQAFLEARGVKGTANLRYGIQDLRRHALFEALGKATRELGVAAADRPRVPAVLAAEQERLLCDRDYEMETGSHKNYWPYWTNYHAAIEKMLLQSAPSTPGFFAIKNRLEDIYDHKTVFTFQREVDESDLERSLGAALVHRVQYSTGIGHRVSLAKGSYPSAPRYEVLTVAARDLPAGLDKHSGARVYRDTDAAGTLRFDPGGAKLPEALIKHVHGDPIDAGELGVRPLAQGESPRRGVPGDWNRNGGIELSAIEIGWWGHCHNESPLNAMGVDPKRAVTLHRAERGIPKQLATQTFSSDDVWDLFGALAADHEAGYANTGSFGMRATQVEVTKFVGSRNDGGHWFLLEFDRQGARRVRIDAEVTQLWHKSEPTKRYEHPEERFRRDLPAEDGTFAPNPDWVAAEASDDDEIAIDCLGRRMTFVASFVTFDRSGDREEAKLTVELDPGKDAWVKIAEEILSAGPRGGKLAEHWYNPKAQRYYRAQVDVDSDGKRREAHRDDPITVTRACAQQETAYDSVIDIHDFVTKNMGLPFTFDTSSGLAVWNYPVSRVRIDRTRDESRTEDGAQVSYTSYRLRYVTMGGPKGDARYIIKRDAEGNASRALALDPMPDFAFRNEYWVCAPATTDTRGGVAYNVQALQAGYLTDKQHKDIVPDLWRRQAAICYASLAAPGHGDTVYAFETAEGDIVIFPDAAAFRAAVEAEQRAAPP